MIPVVDTHVHLVDDVDWVPVPELHRTFSAADFDAVRPPAVRSYVYVPSVPSLAETRRALSVADGAPDLAAVIGWVDLASPGAGANLDALAAGIGGTLLRGVRHPVHKKPNTDWLLRPAVVEGMRSLASRGYLYELLISAEQVEDAVRLAELVPDLRFILDHAGKPPMGGQERGTWLARVKDIASTDRVTCKLSGPFIHGPGTDPAEREDIFAELKDAFGTDRMMYGSNYPLCLLQGHYESTIETVDSLLASDEERHAVFHGVAERVLGVSVSTA